MFTRDTNRAARDVSVPCLRCGTMRPIADMLIDTSGPAFLAYFCADTCAPANEHAAHDFYRNEGFKRTPIGWVRGG